MIVRRADLIAKIEEHLAGRAAPDELAGWAFDRFYAIEQGEEEVDEADAEAIGEVLDDLMFADDESFALDEADLRRLIARLQQP